MSEPFPFDAVLFDLDGTLIATDRFWVPAARSGARQAFAELGLERELPSAEEWMGMVGFPLREAFARVFSDLAAGPREHVLARVVEAEQACLRSGGAALLPGAETALRELAARGVRLGIASNCSAAYLEAMLSELGLGAWIHEARCLDSPGVATKADMLADLLIAFDTQSAVMVGDRASDCDAAHANGLPHVHVTNGFAAPGELVRAEAVLDDLAALVGRLERRAEWIAEVLRSLDVDPARAAGPRIVAITGAPFAGKSLFARDAVRVLAAHGRRARVVSLDDFPGEDTLGGLLASERGLDSERLRAGVLEPFWRGAGAPGEVLFVEGPHLVHPRLATCCDRILYLDLDLETSRARWAARSAAATPERLQAWLSGPWSEHAAVRAAWPPERTAERIASGANPLGEARAPGTPASAPLATQG